MNEKLEGHVCPFECFFTKTTQQISMKCDIGGAGGRVNAITL
jgi:hypothetical protein